MEEEKRGLTEEEEENAQKFVDMCELAAECQQQAAVADMWEELRTEIQDVHTMFNDFSSIVHVSFLFAIVLLRTHIDF